MADDKPGLDLSKLLGSAKKNEAAPAPVAKPAPAEVRLSEKLSFSEPKPTATVVKAGAKTVSPSAAIAPPTKIKTEKALPAAAPSNPKLEKQMSRRGLANDRLNVVQKEERKYPYLYFGADEIYLAIQELMNVVRANLWRALPEYPRFVIGVKIMGAVRRDAFAEWNGEALSGLLDQAPSAPTAYWVLDADEIIDNCRGKLSCVQVQAAPHLELHGDGHLGRLLRVIHVPANEEQLADVREREEVRLAHRLSLRKASKTPAEWLVKMITLRIEAAAKFIVEPIFLRVTIEDTVKQEILFHIEKGKLTPLIGKPGETLVPGAVEVAVRPKALQALWDMECDWHFLFTIGLARASGDLDVLSRLHWVNFEIVRRIRLFNHTQKVPGPEHPTWVDVRLEAKK